MVVLLGIIIVLQIVLLWRKVAIDLSPVEKSFESVERGYERTERAVREEIAKNRDETSTNARKSRDELGNSLKDFSESFGKTIGDLSAAQRLQLSDVREQLTRLTESNEKKLDLLKTVIEERLKSLQEDNAKKLEQMRHTVDEKLQGTLEKRLGESFKLVSERLEQVYKGLGEMQSLASGVGDLKRVLTNVKTRGTWGEIQLGTLLEQILSPDQYATNVATTGGSERVEFAIKLPGPDEDNQEVVWLPIDSKFPLEDYQRLVEAQEQADSVAAEEAGKQLEAQVKVSAQDICSKYLSPPMTTDFGIMFLPTEGLYAEVIRRVGLVETIQQKYRVVVAGPTTLAALLNSLQMGFRTLAIQQRSGEVWNLLAAVKTEFGKYGDILDKVQKKLQEASNTIDKATVRTRAIDRKPVQRFKSYPPPKRRNC